jgi:chromate transporter
MKPSTRQLFTTFLKVGAFTIGGGYAMIPVIEAELVTKQGWMSQEDFLDAVSIAQAIPGIIAVHMAMYMGYKLGGIKGASVSMLGVILPSFLIMIGIAGLFVQFAEIHPLVLSAFRGVRIAVVALITYAGYRLFGSSTHRYKLVLALVIFAVVFWFNLNPFVVIGTIVIASLLLPRKVHQHANH